MNRRTFLAALLAAPAAAVATLKATPPAPHFYEFHPTAAQLQLLKDDRRYVFYAGRRPGKTMLLYSRFAITAEQLERWKDGGAWAAALRGEPL